MIVNTEMDQTGHALFQSSSAKMGWYCFLASLFVHFVMYALHRTHLMRSLTSPEAFGTDAMVQPVWYAAAHISIVNFAIYLPAWPVPAVRLSKYLVLILNATAGIVLVATVTLEHPMERAWGCYPPGTKLADLKFGLCPAFSDNPQDAYAAVCTQPGVRCGFEELRWRNVMGHEISIASTLVSLSAIIYLTSIFDEIKYYMFEYDKAVIRNKKSV
jgi:hypothetical protein